MKIDHFQYVFSCVGGRRVDYHAGKYTQMTLVLNATKLTKLEMTGPFMVMNGVNVKSQLLKTAKSCGDH